MSQDPNNIGLLPPPPLLPTQPLPLPVSQYSTPAHYPPPLPPPGPPLQPVYGMQYPAANLQPTVPGYLNPYQQSVQAGSGISTQSHYNTTPAAAALNPVNQAQALYAAASQMMIGNMMMDHLSSNKRRKKRSGSPKRRMRSRSESPQRNKRTRDSKRRRNRSPNHKRSYNRGSVSPQKSHKREEKKSEEVKKEDKIKEEKDENLHQPPTPEDNVVAADTETENDVPDGNKTPDYKTEDDTPKTPEYDINTGSAVTPPNSTSQQTVLTSLTRDTTSSTNLPDSISTTYSTKTVASVKPTLSLSPKMISLRKIRDTPDISSPAPDVGVKSLAEILREQALKSMKRKPTPERESESDKNTRDAVPETDSLRTRAESPTLDRSTTETAKLARPFDDIDRNMFKPENTFDSEDDFYSDDEFDPKKYARNSEDELLASPERKNDLTGITMNFTVTPKMTKEEKRKAKLERKKAKELKKRRKEDKKLKKRTKKQLRAGESELGVPQNNTDKANPLWQRKMISSHLTGDNTPNTISPHSSPPSTPDEDEAEFLKTPEKCEDIFFESVPTPSTEEPKPKRKAKRKVVVINKDPASSTLQIPSPERKPEVDHSSISTKQPLAAVFGATIRSLVQPKAEQINTVSTTANRQVKGFNPFAPASSQPTPPKPTPPAAASPQPAGPFSNLLSKPDTTRKVPPENKQTRRLGGVKTIKIKKATSATAASTTAASTTATSTSGTVTLDQRLVLNKPAEKPAAAPPTASLDDDLDDSDKELDKELELLNAVMYEEPAPSRPNTKTDNLEDEDDLFADIEEFLNEERRNL